MTAELFFYPVTIKEQYLDLFGHMNNSAYLVLFEEARWELITKRGYGVAKMKSTGIGPTILEINIQYLKELLLRDAVVIETQLVSYEKKIGKILQKMKRGDEICCIAELTIGLFDLRSRKLIPPTDEWLNAIGWS
ncbi:MAG: acyl-CoA thioesterase [Gammaproteobacteria bacterium]|nr:MAG: acyl-CoA thioesterase [Gammaproteobacteria bacterium]